MFFRLHPIFKPLNKQKSFKLKAYSVLFSFVMAAFVPLIIIPTAKGETPPSLPLKWTGYVAGGGEALLAADIRPDIPGMEVVHAGGGAQPGGGTGSVTCLNGITGAQIWKTSIDGIGDTCQPQMSDLNNDGYLEIVVPIQYPAGLYILNSYDGSVFYSNRNLGGGRIDSSPVIGDVNGNGCPDLFVGVMGYENPSSNSSMNGKVIRYEWNPSTNSIVERSRVQVWHPCAGGLSLGDTDNDGTWELYMNERDAYFGDGSWGRGITSFWAENLSVRWRVYDWGASSNIPMLGDVNHDGIQDVISTDLSAGVCVLNSTDGHPLTNAAGQVLSQTRIPGRHNHYQSSVYDIDGDGNLEVLSGDGYEGEFDYVTVFDLYSWRLEASIDTTIQGPVLTRSWKGPTVGEVTGDGQMDIIVTTFDPTTANNGQVQIYDRNYNLVYLNTGLHHRAIESVVQDIDGDGLNELLIQTQGGIIYCYDTPGVAANPRARTEVQFYSESRCGASEYVPYDRPYPDVSVPSPTNGELGVPASTATLSFNLSHPLGQTMNYTVTTSPNIGSGSGSNVGSGQRTVSISGLTPSTLYHWNVTVTDQSGYMTSKDYCFTIGPYTPNRPPTQGQPVLTGSSTVDNLVANPQDINDPDGDNVNCIYNWQKNGASIANVNLPFSTQTNPQDEYSGLAVTRDYANNAYAMVVGAKWVPNGKVDGAYSFDGNDFIRILEPSRTSPRYDGNGAWTGVSVECWAKGITPLTSAKPLISKTNLYDNNISYSLDFCKNDDTDLEFTWRVGTGNADTGAVVYTLGPISITTEVNDWHHVAATYESGIGLVLYVDGVQVGSLLGPGYIGNVYNSDGSFQIGWGGRRGNDFAGLVDEVKLYPDAVSSTMVSQAYDNTKNGSSSSSTISMSDLQVGDRWRCQVTPNDGFADGETLNSDTRTITEPPNTPPIASNLVILPSSPTTNDDLLANYTYFDAEADPELGSIVSWYKNNIFVTTGDSLSSNFTTEGESWTFTVKPSDGFNFGLTAGPSNPVVIMSAQPTPTATPTPTEPTPTPTLNPPPTEAPTSTPEPTTSPEPTVNPEPTSNPTPTSPATPNPTVTPSADPEPTQSPTNDPIQTPSSNPTSTAQPHDSLPVFELSTISVMIALVVTLVMAFLVRKQRDTLKWRWQK